MEQLNGLVLNLNAFVRVHFLNLFCNFFIVLAKSCGHPGEVEYAMREGNEFTFTSKVSYFCKPGYEIIGRTNRYCQSDGQWSHVKPSCRRKSDFQSNQTF